MRYRDRTGPRRVSTRGMDRDPHPGHRQHRHVRAGSAAPGRQQAVRRAQHQGPVPAAGPGRVLGLRLRLLTHLDPHLEQDDVLQPWPIVWTTSTPLLCDLSPSDCRPGDQLSPLPAGGLNRLATWPVLPWRPAGWAAGAMPRRHQGHNAGGCRHPRRARRLRG